VGRAAFDRQVQPSPQRHSPPSFAQVQVPPSVAQVQDASQPCVSVLFGSVIVVSWFEVPAPS
jgi:hypothetical protein